MKTWFITGCSTGLGRALALAVLKRGWNAIVTARDVSSLQSIIDEYPDRALGVALDVRNRPQIQDAIQLAEQKFGGIDVLVNNAGYGYRAAVEEADERDIDDLFATNFFGLVAVTKAVLPSMRLRRQGMIINISSAAGRMSVPGSAYYSASKFAVEGMSDGLRQEVAPLGIGVLVVEPGPFRTDFLGRSLQQSQHRIADYEMTVGPRRKENDAGSGTQKGDPVRGAEAIINAAFSEQPPHRLALGKSALTRIRAELEQQLEELDTWASVTEGADFPDE